MKFIIRNNPDNISKFAYDFFVEVEKNLGKRYEIEKSQFILKFKRIFFYHNHDRISYVTDSLNPLISGTIIITTQQNETTIVSKLNHKIYIVRSIFAGLVVASFIYLSFNLALLHFAVIALIVSAVVGFCGIIYSEMKINKIIKDSYDRLKN